MCVPLVSRVSSLTLVASILHTPARSAHQIADLIQLCFATTAGLPIVLVLQFTLGPSSKRSDL